MKEILFEMLKYYGLREVFGPAAEPEIIKMFKDIGYNWVQSDETAWCSALMNFVCKKLSYERSGKLDARSWLKMSIVVLKPQLGDIVVFWRNSPTSWEGHVGLYISDRNNLIYTLGGNQENMVSIAGYPKSRILGFRQVHKIVD